MSSLDDRVKLNDGRSIPFVGFGTFKATGNDGKEAVLSALKAGYRHLDTAEYYQNEEAVGAAIRESGIPREEIWVTTKMMPPGKTFQHTLQACSDSLQKLGLDYIDLYLIHAPIDVEHRKEQWQALEQLKEEGKARSIGVSNYGPHHLQELLGYAKIPPAVNQFEIHPWLQHQSVVDASRKHGIAVEAYTSLTRGEKLKDPTAAAIADRHGVTVAQVLLKWALQKGYIILPKSSTEARIKTNADLWSFTLTDEDMKTLDSLEEGLNCSGWDPTTGP